MLTLYGDAQFISDDGEYHVIAGALITHTTYAFVYSKNKAFWYGLGASALASIAKEVYNGKPDNHFDAPNVAATVVGGLTACATLSLFVGKKRQNKAKSNALVN